LKARVPLFTRILFLAFLNLCLLAAAMAVIARVQFRLDARSFLLAPAQDRIVAVAHGLSLELEEAAPPAWESVLSRYSQTYGAGFHLFDEFGDKLAGPDLHLPREVAARIPKRERRRDGQPPPPRRDRPPRDESGQGGGGARPPAPPLFLLATSDPTRYWAGVRILLQQHPDENPKPGTLIVTSPSAFDNQLFFDYRQLITVGLAVVLVSVAAGRIAEGQFETQIARQRRDEIGQLGDAINRMASRLSGFVNGQKRFLSGIAHELCTPIATIQFGMANLERQVSEQQRAAVASLQEEVQHMSTLVNELLSFTRAGMQAGPVKLSSVNVAATVARVLDREAPSPPHPIEVSVDEHLSVLADADHLFRSLSNVVRNAVRYARRGWTHPHRGAHRGKDGADHRHGFRQGSPRARTE
jgi:two-component system sensor histidine kinase CpxA